MLTKLAEDMLITDSNITIFLIRAKKAIKKVGNSLAEFMWKIFMVLSVITWPLWGWSRERLYTFVWGDDDV